MALRFMFIRIETKNKDGEIKKFLISSKEIPFKTEIDKILNNSLGDLVSDIVDVRWYEEEPKQRIFVCDKSIKINNDFLNDLHSSLKISKKKLIKIINKVISSDRTKILHIKQEYDEYISTIEKIKEYNIYKSFSDHLNNFLKTEIGH